MPGLNTVNKISVKFNSGPSVVKEKLIQFDFVKLFTWCSTRELLSLDVGRCSTHSNSDLSLNRDVRSCTAYKIVWSQLLLCDDLTDITWLVYLRCFNIFTANLIVWWVTVVGCASLCLNLIFTYWYYSDAEKLNCILSVQKNSKHGAVPPPLFFLHLFCFIPSSISKLSSHGKMDGPTCSDRTMNVLR